MILLNQDEAKAFWKSKTFWASMLTAVLPLIPPVGAWAAANPEIYSAALAALFSALRVRTKVPVKLTP